MGEFPSGQRGQTVNLLSLTSLVRIQLPPPKQRPSPCGSVFCFGGGSCPRSAVRSTRWTAYRRHLLHLEALSTRGILRNADYCASQKLKRNDLHALFPYQKRSNFCLPKVTSFFIQAAGLAYHHDAVVDIISPVGAVSHHAPACISCGLMIYNTSCWWYTMLRIDDIHAFGVLGIRGCENSWITLQYMI